MKSQVQIDKLAGRVTQEKSAAQELRKSVDEGNLRFSVQSRTMVTAEQHRAELSVKEARILELQRQLFESYRAPKREDTEEVVAGYISNLKKEVEHLQGMVRTVGLAYCSF